MFGRKTVLSGRLLRPRGGVIVPLSTGPHSEVTIVNTRGNRLGTPPLWPLMVAAAGYMFFVRPQLRKWGTRLGEAMRRLPGDDIIPDPQIDMTHAANIDAPPEAVWPWLAQMGRDHSGYYSLDMLRNHGIPSVTYLRQDLEPPLEGMQLDGGEHILTVENNRTLLLAAYDLERLPGLSQDITTLYQLERQPDGSTRLLLRHRASTRGAAAPLFNLLYELLHVAGVLQQFAFLKEHSTTMAHLRLGG